MKFQDEYNLKKVSLDEAVSMVRPGDVIGASPAASFPLELINALTARNDISDVKLHSALMITLPDFFKPEYLGKVSYQSAFMGPVERMLWSTGIISATSVHFSQFESMISRIPLDVLFLEVSRPDSHGFMSMGPSTMIGRGLLRNAKKIIVQVNPHVPFINGTEAHIHISEIERLCEVDRPLFEIPDIVPDETEVKIAELIAPRIPDGATIQLGIGKLANAIGDLLTDKKDIGIHTELLTPSMINLCLNGIVTGKKKELHTGKMVAAFCLGKKRDYDFMHQNSIFEMHPATYINNPWIIGRHSNFVSVNNALSVDLTGQVSSESIGFSQYSATGGQLDFVRGARLSEGGQSFIALKSVSKGKGGLKSRICLNFEPGTAITTPRSDVQYIVTEYGIADLDRKSIPERVKAMISIAHPDFRDDLARQAVEAGLVNAASLNRIPEAA